jgi:hypothetical protein
VSSAQDSERWTVRGIPFHLRKAVAEAAWAADPAVGAWLSRPSTVERLEAVERRMDRRERGRSAEKSGRTGRLQEIPMAS